MDHVANYPVVRKLGEGATSEVFLCQDPFRNRQVAVKRIFPESLRDPNRGRLFRKLFFTEASLAGDRKSTRLNSSHSQISYAVFCLKKKIKYNYIYID